MLYGLNQTFNDLKVSGEAYYASQQDLDRENTLRESYGYELMVLGWNNLTNITTFLGHDLNINMTLWNDTMLRDYDNVTILEMYLNRVAK